MAFLLIADDVKLSGEVLARALRLRGHRVAQAADGEDAVALHERERPEVVVMDVNMPRLSGLDAAARIKAVAGVHTPVILVSARVDIASRVAALAVADDFLPKPVDIEELHARIEAHLRTRRVVEELRRAVSPTQQVAALDPQTGFQNRAFFLDRVAQEWRRAARFNEPLSLILTGVEAGEVDGLASVGAVLSRMLRQVDILARPETDQLAALLPNTHVAGALVAAERLKRELAGSAVTTSLGIACYPGRDVVAADDLVRHALQALDRARAEGPGNICLYQNQGYLFRPQP